MVSEGQSRFQKFISVENWEEIKPHLKEIQFDMEMTTVETKEWTTKSQMLPTPTTMDYLTEKCNSMVKQVTEHKGQNQSCQSERSSEPSSSRAIQSSTEFTNSYSKGMERRQFTIPKELQNAAYTWKSNTPLSPLMAIICI